MIDSCNSFPSNPNPDEPELKRNIEQGTRNIELRIQHGHEYFDIPCSIFVIQNNLLNNIHISK